MKQTANSVDPQFAAGAQGSSLYNDDLAPTGTAQRTWRWYHFAALWVGMVMNIASYMLAAGLTEQGMSPWQAVLTVLLGNVIVLVPMLLIGHAGAKHGIPYAVLVRSSFGTQGAKLPAMLRAIVACDICAPSGATASREARAVTEKRVIECIGRPLECRGA